MKTLNCGELVAGCDQTFQGETEDEILAQAGKHAVEAHGLQVTPELVGEVRAHIHDVPAGAGSSQQRQGA
jgi:predicted small metal-binding protein